MRSGVNSAAIPRRSGPRTTRTSSQTRASVPLTSWIIVSRSPDGSKTSNSALSRPIRLPAPPARRAPVSPRPLGKSGPPRPSRNSGPNRIDRESALGPAKLVDSQHPLEQPIGRQVVAGSHDEAVPGGGLADDLQHVPLELFFGIPPAKHP